MDLPAHAVRKSKGRSELLLRLAGFILALPSGFAIMAKVYGVLDMQTFVLAVCLPCIVLLLFIVWRSRSAYPEIGSDLAVGAVAGLIGAVAYDIVRIPASLSGYRVYGTVSVFGLWLLDAEKSSRFTELFGWSYNYFNGICFGMMYALFMRGRHWGFGVLWALILETIAVVTPFGLIFHIRGNVPLLLIAYVSHIAYGLPLGKALQNWRDSRQALREMPQAARVTVIAIAVLWLIHPLLSPGAAAADRRAVPGKFQVEGLTLNPGWLRIQRGQAVEVFNPENEPVTVTLNDLGQNLKIAPNAAAQTQTLEPGIHQFFVQTPGRTQSSFVVVEPVEQGR